MRSIPGRPGVYHSRQVPSQPQTSASSCPFSDRRHSPPLAKNEPLPRDPFLKQSKVTAEGALEEIKTILGWVFDTRRLKVSLPQDKYKAWSSTIESILQKGTANQKELETMIGRQTHAAAIMPMARHFICRIRYAQSKMNYPNQEYKLKKHVLVPRR